MKINFSIKLFLTFLIFGFILFVFAFYLEYKMIKVNNEEKDIKEFIYDIDNIDKKIKKIYKTADDLSNSISSLDVLKTSSSYLIENTLNSIALANKDILEIAILDKNLKSIFTYQKDKTRYKRDIDVFQLKDLKKNTLISSGIDLSIKKDEIEQPLIKQIQFSKKVNSHVIVLFFKVNDLFDEIKNIRYIFDKDMNVIYDSLDIYSWSKYYYSSLTIPTLVPKSILDEMKNDLLVVKNRVYKKLLLDKQNSLILVEDVKKLDFKDFIKNNLNEAVILSVLTFFISFILSLFFTIRVSKVNNKLLIENSSLNDSIKQKRLVLGESLDIIDQNIMYLKMDKNFYIEDVSSYFCVVYGYAKEELLGQHYSILYSKKKYELIKKNILADLKHKKEWKGEILTKRKNGEEYWVESHIKADFIDEEIVSYTIVRKDISDNKKVEELYDDLNYQIEQLNVIFQNVSSGIAMIDLEGNIKKTNMAFCEILNYESEELLLSNILSLVEKRSKNFLENILKELISFGSVINNELIFSRKNSEDIYLNLSLKMLPDKKNIVLVVNSLEDKRKLQELNQTLEQRVKIEVEKNIEKDKIHQEEKLKNAKLTSIGTLAAGITHEINTPLTYLKGNFEMLQMDIDDVQDESLKNEINESCIKISDAITRISVIVESMREMSQKSSEIKEKTNIFSTLFTSLTMAYNVSKQISKVYLNNQEFKLTNINKDDLKIYAKVQKQRIEQVWIIIINNALDELKKIDDYEKRELHIDILEEDDEVVVKFIDNAGGIDKSIISDIFEPFVSSKEHSGMGVGLNIAKKIVDEQDGIIKAYNSNNGAVFEIRLALCKEES